MAPLDIVFRRLVPADIEALRQLGSPIFDTDIPEFQIPAEELMTVMFMLTRPRAAFAQLAENGREAVKEAVAEFAAQFSEKDRFTLFRHFCRSWNDITLLQAPARQEPRGQRLRCGPRRPPDSIRSGPRNHRRF